jgi:hypothetical protein
VQAKQQYWIGSIMVRSSNLGGNATTMAKQQQQ